MGNTAYDDGVVLGDEENIWVDRSMKIIDLRTLEYPLYIKDLGARIGNVSFGSGIFSDYLATFGYGHVRPVTPPEGDVVLEVTPVRNGFYYYETYTSRSFTQEELDTQLRGHKDYQFAVITGWIWDGFEKGIPYRFAEGVYHVPCKADNKADLLACYIKAKECIEAGIDRTFSIRTYENKTIVLGLVDTVAMIDVYLKKVEEGNTLIWNVKDQVEEATSVEDFPELPEEIFTLD